MKIRLLRLLYLISILVTLFLGHYSKVLFHSIIFLVTYVVFLFIKKQNYFLVDDLLMGLFFLERITSFLGVPMPPSVIGMDKLFHLMAGVILGVGAKILFPKEKLINLVAVSIIVGLLWEFFEYFYDLLLHFENITIMTYHDTMLDLVFDTVGIVIGIYITKLKHSYFKLRLINS